MSLRIYDTRAKRKIDWMPSNRRQVGVYACGITPYDLCHVGHARMLVAFDVIVRHLRASGLDVRFVRNVTDIDDKIIRRGHAEGRSAAAVALEYTAAMEADMRALGIAPADVEPRATEHIAEVIEVVQRLVDRGLAYAAEGDVYYAVGSFAGVRPALGPEHRRSQGRRAHRDRRAQAQPARLRAVEGREARRAAVARARGVPGAPAGTSSARRWRIATSARRSTCTAAGSDLIFPHHENEIAQSEGAFGDGRFARHWLHSGMVNFGGEKMSKSLGNVVTIRGVAETHDLESLRLLMLSVHYRSPVAFEIARDAEGRQTYPDLDEAEGRLEYFYRTLERLAESPLPARDEAGAVLPPADTTLTSFRTAMDDDFNTAAALGHLYESFVLANKLLDDPKAAAKDVRRRTLARLRADLLACGATLGIFQRTPSEFLLARRERICVRRNIDPGAVEMRIAERAAARAAKDFARADEIRKSLQATGIELMDSPTGTTWRVV